MSAALLNRVKREGCPASGYPGRDQSSLRTPARARGTVPVPTH